MSDIAGDLNVYIVPVLRLNGLRARTNQVHANLRDYITGSPDSVRIIRLDGAFLNDSSLLRHVSDRFATISCTATKFLNL